MKELPTGWMTTLPDLATQGIWGVLILCVTALIIFRVVQERWKLYVLASTLAFLSMLSAVVLIYTNSQAAQTDRMSAEANRRSLEDKAKIDSLQGQLASHTSGVGALSKRLLSAQKLAVGAAGNNRDAATCSKYAGILAGDIGQINVDLLSLSLPR